MRKLLKPRVYVSTPISGAAGSTATEKYMNINCRIAKFNVEYLNKKYPEIEWFSPGAQDEIVGRLFKNGAVTYRDIMTADIAELKNCNGLLAISWEKSGGVAEEIEVAEEKDIPVEEVDYIYVRGYSLDEFVDGVIANYFEKSLD